MSADFAQRLLHLHHNPHDSSWLFHSRLRENEDYYTSMPLVIWLMVQFRRHFICKFSVTSFLRHLSCVCMMVSPREIRSMYWILLFIILLVAFVQSCSRKCFLPKNLVSCCNWVCNSCTIIMWFSWGSGAPNEIHVIGMDSYITVNFATTALIVGVHTSS
jgi:hypothetical protein